MKQEYLHIEQEPVVKKWESGFVLICAIFSFLIGIIVGYSGKTLEIKIKKDREERLRFMEIRKMMAEINLSTGAIKGFCK